MTRSQDVRLTQSVLEAIERYNAARDAYYNLRTPEAYQRMADAAIDAAWLVTEAMEPVPALRAVAR